MLKDKEIEYLLEGNQRFWNQKFWFDKTIEFIINDLNESFTKESLKFPSGKDLRLISKINNKLSSLDCQNEDSLNDLKTGLIFLKTKEFLLAEEYLLHASKNQAEFSKYCIECKGVMSYLLAKIQIEKMDYRNANDYFLKGFKELHNYLSFYEKLEYFIQWCYLFIETEMYDETEVLLNLIASNMPPQISPIYAHLLLTLFILQKKINQTELAITYANLLLSCPSEYLEFDDWYSIHLFCGEYYASIKRNFEKSIFHFTMANTFLSNKWKEYIKEISLLKDFLKLSEYLKIRITYEDKMQEIILENNLHSSHYITSLKNAYDELQCVYSKVHEFSLTDSLTGLYNRRYLWEKIGEFLSLSAKQKTPISCLMIDFDDFKYINDKYGHIEGDKVLKKACLCIRESFRKTDIIIRFGGEEILVFLFNVNSDNAIKLADKLRNEIENLIIISDLSESIKVTVSIGISTLNQINLSDPHIIDKMIEDADNFMYQAKNNGKNRIYYKK